MDVLFARIGVALVAIGLFIFVFAVAQVFGIMCAMMVAGVFIAICGVLIIRMVIE